MLRLTGNLGVISVLPLRIECGSLSSSDLGPISHSGRVWAVPGGALTSPGGGALPQVKDT